ncbi:MAG: hypothetical protein O2854_10005 [Chloroflexi bacterium]|nr:hypothetical protein [Chloroflexota bacterium]
MSTTKEKLLDELETLSEEELEQLTEFVEFLKFQGRRRYAPEINEAELAALYAEFAAEDRDLAEAGMADYARGLKQEDVR